jgi:hypothetical protein
MFTPQPTPRKACEARTLKAFNGCLLFDVDCCKAD